METRHQDCFQDTTLRARWFRRSVECYTQAIQEDPVQARMAKRLCHIGLFGYIYRMVFINERYVYANKSLNLLPLFLRSPHTLEVVLLSRYYPQGSYQLVLSLVCSLRASDSRFQKKVTIHGYCSWGTVHGYYSSKKKKKFIALMDVLKFSGVYPESWIFSITEYFSLLNTPADQWLKIVGFNLEGAAAEWFQWMTRNGLITTWARFEESVRNCFGPSEYEDPNEVLSKLLQLGTVKDYQREF
ncbi:ty3-gypsy retrotransposon protein [Tanacetum coccineum]|uniref:Ty3-gypsy retrotransposon protein n=1 Tax=Tanacetum coccineum TaxID=301880 RepID=A0ABQ5APW9_9ASTR